MARGPHYEKAKPGHSSRGPSPGLKIVIQLEKRVTNHDCYLWPGPLFIFHVFAPEKIYGKTIAQPCSKLSHYEGINEKIDITCYIARLAVVLFPPFVFSTTRPVFGICLESKRQD